MSLPKPVSVFFSYSHRDERFRNQLLEHMSSLKSLGIISNWHDRMIIPGQDWDKEIRKKLEEADIILLMISSSFLASDYIRSNELTRAVERHNEGSARLVPIILRPCVWIDFWVRTTGGDEQLGKHQALPKDGRPITDWRNRDKAWVDVVRGIWQVISELELIRQKEAEILQSKVELSEYLRQKERQKEIAQNEAEALYMFEEKVKEKAELILLQRAIQLEETQVEILRRLARAAEYREDDTGEHIERVSTYAAQIASEIGWPEAKVEILRKAATLHDVGKIGISDILLFKPGKYTEAEWEMIKTHTTIGAEILAGGRSELMRMAEVIAVSHHERWDGKGYPKGLSGEEIPEAGRIVAVADVFDAFTRETPYKQAWPVDNAVKEIERMSGTHFDPKMVRAFLRVLSK